MSKLLRIFSGESNKQQNLHCTASRDGARPSMRQKHSYIHVLGLSLDASPHVFSFLFSPTWLRGAHQGTRLVFPRQNIHFQSGVRGELRYIFCPARIASRLRAARLASHEGDGAPLKSLCVFTAAVLRSAHSRCALPTTPAATYRP